MRDLVIKADQQRVKSRRGFETRRMIIVTALDIFINEGYSAFTLQRVADLCGLSRGNVTYHYGARKDLLQALLSAVIAGYIDAFKEISADTSLTVEDKFLKTVDLIMEDLGTEQTANFFPQLWALSMHNEHAREGMDQLYDNVFTHFETLIAQMNPAISDEDRRTLSVHISVSLEGHTPFVGPSRKFRENIGAFSKIAGANFLRLIKSYPEGLDTDTAGNA